MKFRHFITSMAVTAVAAMGVLAGLNQRKEAEVAQADGEKWMITIAFDNTNPETSQDWGYVNDYSVHFWGTNLDYNVNVLPLHPTGTDHLYAVNAVFESNQVISGMQLVFHEDGVEKQSQDITGTWGSEADGRAYYYSFPTSPDWTDGKWSVTYSGYEEPFGSFNSTQLYFIPDPNTASYSVKDVELEAGQFVSLCPFKYSMRNWRDSCNVLREADKDEYIGSTGETWFSIKSTGTYDFFITNEYSDGGIVSIKKHEAEVETYIYYVTNSASATTDYIYSWGGSQQFGAFPGTAITSVTDAEEVTGNGVLHFQGGDDAKLIYRIPITTGYPTGDSMFMFNNGTSEYKSSERPIVNENAYWWTGDANFNAAQGLNYLITAESYRNGATDTSVCNIDKASAAFLVNLYNAYDQGIRETYIDSSTVYTHKRDGSAGNELVSYRVVVEQLGAIAEVAVVGSSRIVFESPLANSTAIVVIVVSMIAATSLIAVVVITKKRKHE